jgi:4-amino-4-deoxy-L-arabinose transferase-like glycosyltransferase
LFLDEAKIYAVVGTLQYKLLFLLMDGSCWVMDGRGIHVPGTNDLRAPLSMAPRSHMARRSSPSRGLKGFRADLADVLDRYSKRTSLPHKRTILLLILAGAALRVHMASLPITYEEARAFELFSSRRLSTIVTDLTDPLNHILYNLLAKWSVDIFGVGRFILRLPALLAGVLMMPVLYLFTRAMFNRYIAMLALALVASSAPLIEYSALAHGHSITWLCLVVALALGRHFAQQNNAMSAVLIALFLALGMWALPAMLYPALAVLLWLLFYILMRYEGSLRPRLMLLLLTVVLVLVFTFLFYLPVIAKYGIGQIMDPDQQAARSWKIFQRDHADGIFALWAAISDTTGSILAVAGLVVIMVSAFISTKYRALLFAVPLTAIPLVLMMARVAPPETWYYTLIYFHLGTAIAVFYLLKAIQEKLFPAWGKRTRTAYTSVALFATFVILGLRTADRIARQPDAAPAAAYLAGAMGPGDRIVAESPLDAPLKFHAYAMGLDRSDFQGMPDKGGWVFVVVEPQRGQRPERALVHHRVPPEQVDTLKMVKDWPGMKIFAARYHGEKAADTMREAPASAPAPDTNEQ